MIGLDSNTMLIILGSLFGLGVIVSIIGEIRKNNIKKTLSDPNFDLVQHLLKKYQELKNLPWPEYKLAKGDFEKIRQAVEDKLSFDQSMIPKVKTVGLLELYILMSIERITEVVSFNQAQENISNHLTTVKGFTPDFTLDQIVKHNFYYTKDSTYRIIHNQTQEWEEAVSRYQNVLSEINEAQSAVSSAQTMEVVDMFSKNKGISVLSSISNSSASGEIRDINPAISRLKDQLQKLSESQPQLAKEIEVSDTLDLITDLAFDFSFDFMSVFSYMKLSSAGSDLDSLERDLRPLGDKINSTYKKHEELRLKALASLE